MIELPFHNRKLNHAIMLVFRFDQKTSFVFGDSFFKDYSKLIDAILDCKELYMQIIHHHGNNSIYIVFAIALINWDGN